MTTTTLSEFGATKLTERDSDRGRRFDIQADPTQVTAYANCSSGVCLRASVRDRDSHDPSNGTHVWLHLSKADARTLLAELTEAVGR